MRDGICIAKEDGSAARKVTDGYDPEISPDGNHIAFTHYNKNGDRKIAIADIASGGVHVLTSIPGANSYGPRWSPDGSKLLFNHYSASDWCMAWVNANDSNFRMLRPEAALKIDGGLYSPCWGEGGNSIICQDMDKVLEFNLDGSLKFASKFTTLMGKYSDSVSTSSAIKFSLSLDGSLLLFHLDDVENLFTSVYRYDMRQHTIARMTPYELSAAEPSWTHDGRAFLFSGYTIKPEFRTRDNLDVPVPFNIYRCSVDGREITLLIRNGSEASIAP